MASDKRSLIDESPHSNGDIVHRTASEGVEPSKKHRKKMQYSGNELIVAVFVTTFDTKKG